MVTVPAKSFNLDKYSICIYFISFKYSWKHCKSLSYYFFFLINDVPLESPELAQFMIQEPFKFSPLSLSYLLLFLQFLYSISTCKPLKYFLKVFIRYYLVACSRFLCSIDNAVSILIENSI